MSDHSALIGMLESGSGIIVVWAVSNLLSIVPVMGDMVLFELQRLGQSSGAASNDWRLAIARVDGGTVWTREMVATQPEAGTEAGRAALRGHETRG